MNNIAKNKIMYHSKSLKDWSKITKDLIKIYGFGKILDKLSKVVEEVAIEENKNIVYNNSKPINTSKTMTKLADEYGLKPLGRKLRICPFHADKDPSLSLSNEKQVFNCFGCGVKGNIVKFNIMLKRLKNGIKQG